MHWLRLAQATDNTLSLDPDSVVCLISYEDAAVAAVRALQNGKETIHCNITL